MDEPRLVPLRGADGKPRAYAIVDADDFERISAHRWRLNSGGYAARNLRVDGRQRYRTMHREVMELPLGHPLDVDHRNGVRIDNRRSNLRVVKPGEQAQNRTVSSGSSKHRGVTWDADHERWRAQVRIDGKAAYLGLFDDEEEAARVAAEARTGAMPLAID